MLGTRPAPMGQLTMGKVRGAVALAQQGKGGRTPGQGWGLQGCLPSPLHPWEGQWRGNRKDASAQKLSPRGRRAVI